MIDGERWHCRHRIAAAGFCTITTVLCVALAARWVRGGEDDRSVDLEKLEQFGGAREQYQKAEKVMKAALHKAHEYEHRAAVQSHLEGKDERMHYELVKAARDRADELRRQDRKVSQISDVRERMEDALRATTAVLMLHEKRLEDVMGQERTSTVKATRLQEDVDGLEKSAGNMQASVQNLKLQTEEMKRRFKVEEHDTSSTKTSQDLEKLLTQYASKKVKETDRELAAKSKERAARASARSKQAEALQLQARADLIQKQLVNLNCYEKFSKTGLGFIPYGSQLSKALDKKKVPPFCSTLVPLIQISGAKVLHKKKGKHSRKGGTQGSRLRLRPCYKSESGKRAGGLEVSDHSARARGGPPFCSTLVPLN